MTKEEIRATLSHLERLATEGTLPRNVYLAHKESLMEKLRNTKHLAPDSVSGFALPKYDRSTLRHDSHDGMSAPSSLTPQSWSPLEQHSSFASPQSLDDLAPNSLDSCDDGLYPPATEDTPKHLPTGTVLRERYQLERLLGEGSTGTVFLASDLHFGGSYALKVFHPRVLEHAETFTQLVRAFQASQQIKHPAVARALSLDEDPKTGHIFGISEYIEGQSLAQILRRAHTRKQRPPLAWRTTLSILHNISNILTFLHKKGIIHRDLKPTNIMLQADEQGLQIKLLDIGLGRRLRQSPYPILHTGEVNSLFYIAPEQLAGLGPFTPATDVFSVGVLLYLMLTGNAPTAMAPRPSELFPHYPKEIDRVLQKAMHLDSSRRYPSLQALETDFALALGAPRPTKHHFVLPEWLITPTAPSFKRPKLDSPAIAQAPTPETASALPPLLSPQPFRIPDTVPPLLEDLPTPPSPQPETTTLPPVQLHVHKLSLRKAHPENQALPLLAVTHNKQLLAVSDHENLRIELWDTQSWRQLHTITLPQPQLLSALSWNAQGERMAFGTETGEVWIWDSHQDNCKQLLSHQSPPRALCWHPTKERLYVGCEDGTIHIWNTSQEEHEHSEWPHRHPLLALARHPTRPLLASCDSSGLTRILVLEDRSFCFTLPETSTFALGFSPLNEHQLLIGTRDGRLQTWDISNGQLLAHSIPHHGPLYSLQISAERNWIATGAGDGKIVISALPNHQVLLSIDDQEDPIYALALAQDGSWLACINKSHALTLWKLTST